MSGAATIVRCDVLLFEMTSSSDTPRRSFVARVLRPFQEFAQTESFSGLLLLCCTALTLIWANSPFADSYFHLWETRFTIGPSGAALSLSLHEWINDALMAVFFLLVGLEIKRELLVGELSDTRQAALPIMAALGGMIVPALIYAAFNGGSEGSAGWGIPMATDIAFALGVLALLGARVPLGLKVFLAALAIVDDLGAVLVIALFYTATIHLTALAGAGVCLAILFVLNRIRVGALLPYIVVGVALWLFVLKSGVHATIAGVLLAMTIPANGPLMRLEHRLHYPVSFGIMPVFAIANAGVSLAGATQMLASPVALGVGAGLVIGKAIGISLFSWLAVRVGIASLPNGVTTRMLLGVAFLGGIGFTMSLFIAGLAFRDPALLDEAKLGVLAASTVAGLIGYAVLRASAPTTPNESH